MSTLPIFASRPEDEAWDVIVVGTGMGGATVGYALAKQGHKVLFLEKGLFLFGEHDRGPGTLKEASEVPDLRLKTGHWPLPLQGQTTFGSVKFFAPLGCGTGGSSSLYASQLERLQPSDFEPKRHHSQATESSLPERWPITYDELLPYYREAERIFAVCGTDDPLNPDPESPVRAPPDMSPRDQFLFKAFEKSGLHPYRAHVGCKYIPDCLDCGGALCPKPCKSDSGRVCLLPALHEHDAKILTECEVLRLEADGSRVQRVHCRYQGKEIALTGKMVVVAAGALMTPIVLLRSKSDAWPEGLSNRSGLVGRNLMMHTSDNIALRPSKTLSDEGPAKAISVNDFYLKDGRKMGTLQSMGVPVNEGVINAYLKLRSEKDPKWYLSVGGRFGRRVASKVGAAMFGQSSVFASVVEDLPYHDNRVELDDGATNGMRFCYTYPKELRERNERFREELKNSVGKNLMVIVLNGENNLNFGHVSGTCRSGDDPEKSVVDKNNRSHDVENLYVADGSSFPSSGGTNPSLTIAANALRVADAISAELSTS